MFKFISWVFRIMIIVILGQTLFFKFSGANESVALFTQLGLEPYGRIGIGVAELIACILLLIPSCVWLGAVLSASLMAGALMSHLVELGFEGEMFSLSILALVALVASMGLLMLYRQYIIRLICRGKSSSFRR